MKFGPLPVTRAIVLDPWLEPLPSPGPTPLQVKVSLLETPRPIPRLLLLNSEGFTLWTDHFARLKELSAIWKQSDSDRTSEEPPVRLLSLIRAQHMSFSDAGILFPTRLNPFGQNTSESQIFLDVITNLCYSFLESGDDFAHALEKVHIREQEIVPVDVAKKDKPTKWDKKFVGNAGDVIVHL